MSGGEVRTRRFPAREESGIQIKHLDFIECFSNCVFGNGFLGNTARQAEWPSLRCQPQLQTQQFCFDLFYTLDFLTRCYLKRKFHDLKKSENCSHAIKLLNAFKPRNSAVSFLFQICVLKAISTQGLYEGGQRLYRQ